MDASFWRFEARMVTVLVFLMGSCPLPLRLLPKPLPTASVLLFKTSWPALASRLGLNKSRLDSHRPLDIQVQMVFT